MKKKIKPIYNIVIDTTGLRCPLPVLKVQKDIKALTFNKTALVIADDPLASVDIGHFCEHNNYYLNEISNNILNLIKKKLETTDDQMHIFDEFKKYKKQLLTEFSDILIWNEVNIEGVIKNVVANHQIPFKSLAQPIRLSLTGSVSGPSLYKIIKILGKEETIQRIKDN